MLNNLSVTQLAHRLARQQLEYETVATTDGQFHHIRFIGPFEGQDIIWDAEIMTLTHARQQAAYHTDTTDAIKQFIQVGEHGASGRKLQVALAVTTIDATILRKTIIMVRQYKALVRGQHNFGPSLQAIND